MANVFFDVQFGTNNPNRIVFKLYDDVVPRTAANFRELAIGCTHLSHIIQQRDMDTKDLPSTESSQISWPKEVTSQSKMVQEESQFMERNSK